MVLPTTTRHAPVPLASTPACEFLRSTRNFRPAAIVFRVNLGSVSRGDVLLWLEDLVRDLKYGFRMVRSAKLISIAVVLTLAIGIGINTGVFTLINGVLLRPRTDSDPATFARLYAQYWLRGKPLELGGQFSLAAYRSIQTESQALQDLAAWRADGVLIEEETTRTLALEVSCNFFSVYGLTQPRRMCARLRGTRRRAGRRGVAQSLCCRRAYPWESNPAESAALHGNRRYPDGFRRQTPWSWNLGALHNATSANRE